MKQRWFTELRHINWKEKPWLILGKGPSFEKISDLDLAMFNVLALNHTGLYVKSSISLFIDVDVYSSELLQNASFVIAPQHPHVNFRPAVHTLFELIPFHRRIFQFRLSTWKRYNTVPQTTTTLRRSPIINVKYFSGEAAFQILGYLGVKDIFSLGIDGGQTYAKVFSHLTPLTNKQKSFDPQFFEIKKTCSKFDINWIRL